MYRHRRRAAGPAPDIRLYRQNPLPRTGRHVQQRHRGPAAAGLRTGRSDLRGHQHAGPERGGLRPCADQSADGRLHHGLLGIRHRRIQARRGGLPAPISAVRRPRPIRSTNSARGGCRPSRTATRRRLPKTANTSPSRPTTRSRSSVSPTLSISKAKGSTCGCISATDRPSPRSSA